MKTSVPSGRGQWLLLLTALSLSLAPRAFPVDLLVSNNNDSGAGSLRQAIVSNNATAGGNTILFSNVVTGTITLTGGELFIAKNLTILGPGAKVLAVNGNAASRVLHFSNCVATVSGLTLTNGYTTASGGGIFNNHSTLTISNCLVTGNSANSGGGIYHFTTTGQSLALLASTVSRNSATVDGGGIETSGIMTVTNSTIFGNSANAGGGIRHFGNGALTVTASTIASNSATTGGGIRLQGSSGTQLQIGGTILKTGSGANISKNSSPDVISTGYNLSSDNASAFLNQATDLNSTDPLLGPLQDNGGPTPTLALKFGSPAIDKSKSFALTTDQRGQPRSYNNPNIANAAGGDGADIGAYEASEAGELRIVNAQKTGAHLRLDFISWFGTNYEVQSRSDLTTGNWASLPGSTPGNGGIVSITVSNAFGGPRQFYRIQAVPCAPGTPGCPWQQGDVFTRTQTGWDNLMSWYGAYDSLYASTFGIIEVGIPGTAGFSLRFTAADRVSNFFVQSGTPAALTGDLVDTTSSSSRGFGGEALALRMNIDFSAGGALGGSVSFGTLHLCGMTDTSLNNLTVSDVMDIANTLLGGGSNGYDIVAITDLLGQLNNSFMDGTPSPFAQAHLVNGPCP